MGAEGQGAVAVSPVAETAVTAEASIFAEKGAKLIWSARTRTTNAQSVKSGADAARQYIPVILDAMKKDKLF